jgi:hypothetical protein
MMQQSDLVYMVRINGVLPDISTIGDEQESERAAEVKKFGISANTSCSLFLMNKKALKSPLPTGSMQNSGSQAASENQLTFHLLVDIGNGVLDSLQSIRNISDLTSTNTRLRTPVANSRTSEMMGITKDASDASQDAFYLPNALLITHAHDDHIQDLPLLLENIRRLSNDATFEI